MNKAIIENKSAVTIHGLKPGGKIPVEVDQNGTPLNKRWRRRLMDSKIDGAIVMEEATTKKKEK
jgi:hypothetical protein